MGIDGWKTEDRNLYMCGVLSSGPVFTPVLQILPEGRKILDITFGPSCTTIILFDPTSSRNVPIFFLKHFFSLFLIFVLVFLCSFLFQCALENLFGQANGSMDLGFFFEGSSLYFFHSGGVNE